MGTGTKTLRGEALFTAILLAIALAFSVAFTAPGAAGADEGDSQDGALTAQAAPDAINYTDNDYKIVQSDMVSTFGMLGVKGDFSITHNTQDKTITIEYTPSNGKVYKYIYVNASKSDKLTWTDDKKQEQDISNTKKVRLVLDEKFAGKAWPIAAVKSDGTSTTEEQYFLAIPPLETIDGNNVRPVKGFYQLSANNEERMFKVAKAVLKDYDGDDDILIFYLTGSSYSWAYSGNQDAAVASFTNRATDPKWAARSEKAVSFPGGVTFGTYDGGTDTVNEGYEFRLPVTVTTTKDSDNKDQKIFKVDTTVYSGGNKLGETGQNFSARSFLVNYASDAMTLTASSASDTASVSVTSTLNEIQNENGSITYTGFTRPYIGGDQKAEKYPLSNDWVGSLTLNLGNNSIYDKAYVENFEGRPWLVDNAAAVNPQESDIASVGDDGNLELNIVNEYDTTPKTTQLNGNIIKVMMHVKANAGVAKKDLWVERTFQLDFTNRTTATLKITGDSLDAPMVAPLADRGEDASKDIAAEPNGYGLSITPVEGSTNTYNVAFTGTGLKKHYNGQKTLGYWAGIAIPSITGKYCKYGAGTYAAPKTTKTYTAAGADKVRKDDGSYNEGGFDDFWFNLGEADTRDKAYVAVFEDSSASTPSAVYNLDFSKMKLVYGITAANTTNGTIAVAEEATEDDTVKVTATPATGYKLAKMSYSLPGGQLADITDKTEFMMPSGDTTISATFDLISYQVAFESNGGSAVAAQTVNHGAKINKPSDPTRSGYTFDGWYSDKELKAAYDFANAVTADTTLYAKWTENPKPAPEPAVESQAMHRLYNPNSGEHFFTASDLERDHLVSLGWNSEDDGWVAPATSNTPVYRLYNPNAGEHHYTMSVTERDHLVSVGWNYESIGWYSDDAQTVPLYRVYNPNAFANNHHYTTSAAERDWLVGLGWNDEGKAWYGLN